MKQFLHAFNDFSSLQTRFITGLILLISFIFGFSNGSYAQGIIVKYENAGDFTFTAPCGLPTAKVEAWGGGGRGGNSNLNIPNITFEDEGVYTVEVNIGTFTYSDATDVAGTSNGIIADSNNKTISGTLTSADFYVTVDEPLIKYYSETKSSKKLYINE